MYSYFQKRSQLIPSCVIFVPATKYGLYMLRCRIAWQSLAEECQMQKRDLEKLL